MFKSRKSAPCYEALETEEIDPNATVAGADAENGIEEIFAPISEALTNEVVTELNGQVDNDGIDPSKVAKEWLTDNGFIG